MINIKYKFLIFVLFLSPVIQALDVVDVKSIEPIVIEASSCHDNNQSESNTDQVSCECENCQCGCLYNNLTTIELKKSKFLFQHNTLVVFFNAVIPFQESHPPFRPPIS